jgi:hypothetical protein
VAIQLGLVGLGEAPVGVHLRRVLDRRLVVRDAQRAVLVAGIAQRHERALAAEQTRLDQRPLGLVGLLVEVDLLDRADLVAVVVVQILAAQLQHAVLLDGAHGMAISLGLECVGTPLRYPSACRDHPQGETSDTDRGTPLAPHSRPGVP